MIRQVAATVVALCLSASPLQAQNASNTRKLTVSEASAPVHKTPSVGSPVIGNAPRGTELVVTREVGSWVKVAWPSAADGVGYVRLAALANAAAPAAAKAPATATTAKAAPAVAPVSSKTAVAPAASVAPAGVRTEQIPVSQPSAPSQARTLYVAPTHIFGVGAVAGGSTMGFGGSARGWKNGRLGVQLEFTRYSYDSVDLLSRATSSDIAPAILFALNDHVSDSLWVRPYVGVAGHLVHSSRRDLIFTDVTESANTFGVRGFFGAEMSMASFPQLAVSADIGYYRMPEPFVGFEPGGMGFAISAHWYVK
jgi:Bacterial SH3 domain